MPFNITIDTSKLSKGLRPSKRMPRNSGFLVECSGAVGKDGVLQTLEELTRLATDTITDAFPYPQIFVFTNLIIVCSSTKIYEWISGALDEKLEVSAGSLWTAVDFYDFIYMSNGTAAVIRNPESNEFSAASSHPKAMAICNYNGQVLIGAPDIDGAYPGASLTVKPDSLDVSVTQHGEWT